MLRKTFTVSTSGNSGMNSSLINKLKNISEKDKEILVQKVFSSVSKRYDFMNDLMSFGLHRVWKDYLTKQININDKSIVLDLASGSGDIIKNLKKKSSAKFVALDANLDMIKEAKNKINDDNVYFVRSFAEKLPFKDNCFDIITVSFGIRNFYNIDKALNEISRVLKKDGYFFCLEFSTINNKVFEKIYSLYSKIIPRYGSFFVNDTEAYSYLIQSIQNFPNQKELSKKIVKSGLNNVEVFDIMNGLASIHIASR